MNSADACEVCKRLSDEYEAATMEWFRVQGQLRIAEFAREEESSSRIIAELSRIAGRRQSIRETREKHTMEAHPRANAAG